MVTKTKGIGRIILTNTTLIFFCCIILILTYRLQDDLFLDVLFLYILLSPVASIGIFIYSKAIDKMKQGSYLNNN